MRFLSIVLLCLFWSDYIRAKRLNGCWGDDPEIQVVIFCERSISHILSYYFRQCVNCITDQLRYGLLIELLEGGDWGMMTAFIDHLLIISFFLSLFNQSELFMRDLSLPLIRWDWGEFYHLSLLMFDKLVIMEEDTMTPSSTLRPSHQPPLILPLVTSLYFKSNHIWDSIDYL